MTSTTTRAMQVAEPGTGFTLVQVDTPPPGPGQVRVDVEACGICHSDAMITGGYLPGTTFPVTTGHEIAGRIESIGAEVTGWAVGDRVAVGWYGGSCGHCDACREETGSTAPRCGFPGSRTPAGTPTRCWSRPSRWPGSRTG